MSIGKEFKEFALKGNVIDLAIGVIIGAAFGKIVTSAVDDIFDRIADLGASFLSDSMGDLSRSYASVGRAVYASAARYYKDKEKVAKVREILERAARDIDEALASTKL